MKVENMRSTKSGQAVCNQFIIRDNQGNKYFQSYRTIIAVRTNSGRIVLDTNSWDYSRTTGKYRNEFLGENTAETRKNIKAGVYQLADLNNGQPLIETLLKTYEGQL
jgi:hypothetical protein